MRKRILSFLLALVMVLGMVPAMAPAARAASNIVAKVEAVGTGYAYDSEKGAFAPRFSRMTAYDPGGNAIDIEGFVWSTAFYTKESFGSANRLLYEPEDGVTYYFAIYVDQYVNEDVSYDYTDSKSLMEKSVVTLPGFEVECISFMEREMQSYLELTYAATRKRNVPSSIRVNNVELSDGQYLHEQSTGASDYKPSEGSYAYYKDGILELVDFNNNNGGCSKGYGNVADKKAVIVCDGDLIVRLTGTNAIRQIYDNGGGVFAVNGSLTIYGSNAKLITECKYKTAIYAAGHIAIDGGTYKINKSSYFAQISEAGAGNISIQNAAVTLTDVGSAVETPAGSIYIKDSTLDMGSDGFFATTEIVVENSNINATDPYGFNVFKCPAGSVKLLGCNVETNEGYSNCFNASEITIHGGKVSSSTQHDTILASTPEKTTKMTVSGGAEVELSTNRFGYANHSTLTLVLKDGLKAIATKDDITWDTYQDAPADTYKAILIGANPHRHSYPVYSYNDTYHWNECIDPDCPDKTGSVTPKKYHEFNSDYDATCDICGYIRKVAMVVVRGIGMGEGDYLANGASAVTTTKPSSGGYAYYKDGILTLNNFSSGSFDGHVIEDNKEIRLNLVGKNTLASNKAAAYGIFCGDGSIYISGTGSLETHVPNAAIYAKRNVTVTDATITILSSREGIVADSGIMTLDNAAVTMQYLSGYGIMVDSTLTIAESTVTIDCVYDGIYADNTAITGSTVTVNSGVGLGIGSDSRTTITGSTITVSADENGIYGPDEVRITDSNATIKSTNQTWDNNFWAIYSDGLITIDPALQIQASTEPDATLGTYDPAKHTSYDYIKITRMAPAPEKPYKIVNVVSGVHVYWKTTAGAVKYGLWRSETGKNGTYKWIANPTVPHFTDTKVESGKTYYYKVTSMDAAGNHSEKSEAIGVTYVATPDITSRFNKAAGITVGWDKITGATGYAIYRKSYSGDDAWVRVGTVSGNSTFTWQDTEVKNNNGTVYRYTVRALAGSDMKTLSGCRNTGRTMARLTSRVLNSAVKASATSIKCSWTTSSVVTGYEVRFMVGTSVYKTFTVGNYKTGVKTFTGLKAGQTYKIQVRSYLKVDGMGFYSAWSEAKNVKL